MVPLHFDDATVSVLFRVLHFLYCCKTKASIYSWGDCLWNLATLSSLRHISKNKHRKEGPTYSQCLTANVHFWALAGLYEHYLFPRLHCNMPVLWARSLFWAELPNSIKWKTWKCLHDSRKICFPVLLVLFTMMQNLLVYLICCEMRLQPVKSLNTLHIAPETIFFLSNKSNTSNVVTKVRICWIFIPLKSFMIYW